MSSTDIVATNIKDFSGTSVYAGIYTIKQWVEELDFDIVACVNCAGSHYYVTNKGLAIELYMSYDIAMLPSVSMIAKACNIFTCYKLKANYLHNLIENENMILFSKFLCYSIKQGTDVLDHLEPKQMDFYTYIKTKK